MGTEIIFSDKRLKEEYESLEMIPEFKWLHRALTKAFTQILETPGIGIPLKKYRIPKRMNIDNLWKYDLPSGWRLLYSLGKEGITVIALILEWCDHDAYQKKYSGRK